MGKFAICFWPCANEFAWCIVASGSTITVSAYQEVFLFQCPLEVVRDAKPGSYYFSLRDSILLPFDQTDLSLFSSERWFPSIWRVGVIAHLESVGAELEGKLLFEPLGTNAFNSILLLIASHVCGKLSVAK